MNPIEIWTDIVITVLALATFIMAWKTKTLTDVVEEMAQQTTELASQTTALTDQTRVLTERLNLEISLSNHQRFPGFIVRRFAKGNSFDSELYLHNLGQYATNFHVTDMTEVTIESKDIKYDREGKTELNKDLTICIHHKTFGEPNDFSFTLNYKDGYGKLMKQYVEYKKPHLTITPNLLLS